MRWPLPTSSSTSPSSACCCARSCCRATCGPTRTRPSTPARAVGLRTWAFDIGAHVKKGQRLAVIASPEVDQQLAQAKADLETVQGQRALRPRSRRATVICSTRTPSPRRTRTTSRPRPARRGNQVQSATSNVRRLAQLTAFENVVAPFDGVVTARAVDIGTLIDAGAGRELFHMVTEDVLRVSDYLPQVYSASAIPGVVGEPHARGAAGPDVLKAPSCARPAPSIRRRGTLLVEVDVDNRKQEPLPGAYAQVHLKLNNPQRALIIPVPTLICSVRRPACAVADKAARQARPHRRSAATTAGTVEVAWAFATRTWSFRTLPIH